MANNKTGFVYYSTDTNRYQDIKIKKLKRSFGGYGVAIYDYILCEIYRVKGCFIEWDESTAFDVADYWDIKESLVVEIVSYCCNVGLFDKELLTSEGILSSKPIINRYIDWSKKAKRNFKLPENISKLLEVSAKLPEEVPKLQEECTQSKVKESKVDEPDQKLYEMFRRCCSYEINDQQIFIEIGKFKNKYPSTPINKSGPLVNAWASNMNKGKIFKQKEMVR